MFKNYKKILPTLIRLIYTIFKVGRISLNNVSADYIVWAPHFFSLRFFSGDDFQKIAFSFLYLKKKVNKLPFIQKKILVDFQIKRLSISGEIFTTFLNLIIT